MRDRWVAPISPDSLQDVDSVKDADVAQLVEQPIRNRQVSGSSPLVGSNPFKHLRSVHRDLLHIRCTSYFFFQLPHRVRQLSAPF